MIRTQITFTQEQLKLLKETAYNEDSSIAEIVRKAVDDKFKRKKTAMKPIHGNIGDRLIHFAQKAQKKGVKGPADLSTNLDCYLYGAAKKS